MKLTSAFSTLFSRCKSFLFSKANDSNLVIHLLENEKITEVNIDNDKFMAYLAAISNYLKTLLQDLPSNQKIGIQVIAHPTSDPSYQVYANPSIENSLNTQILTSLGAIKAERTKLVDFPILFCMNCKRNEKGAAFQDYIDPVKQKRKEYENADLQTKLRLIKAYAIDEVLPVLTAYFLQADDKFAGVKDFGKLMAGTNFNQPQNISQLIGSHKNYWRATMEMDPSDQLVPTAKIFALVSQGEIDHAQKYLEIIQPFSDSKTVAGHYLKEVLSMISLFKNKVIPEIEKGIAQHDAEKFTEAIQIYNELLKVYPNSAWALYEKSFSENEIQLAEGKSSADRIKEWDRSKVEIYKHNPLYEMGIYATTGQDAYLLQRRMEIGELLKSQRIQSQELYSYAEIASDLGVYDFAAQLFWLLVSAKNAPNDQAISHYFYCLDKLGEQELKSSFNRNHEAEFKAIDAEKDKRMKSNAVYKSMENM